MKRGKLSLVAASVAGALVLAACGSDDGGKSGEKVTGGNFVMYLGEPEHLIPTNTNESEGSQVLDALFTGLLEYDPQTSKPQNAMAQSITPNAKQTIWTIKIKDGWTFHNGEPVTAQSYVDSWNYGALSTNAQGNSYFFDKIKGYKDTQGDAEKKIAPKAQTLSGLKVVDKTTFEATLDAPFSQFSLLLGYTAFYPMPKAAFANAAATKAFEEAPIGNGPYMMDPAQNGGKWKHDESIKIKRFEGYKGKKGNADTIEFRIYKEVDTAYTDIQGGNIDIVDSVPPAKIVEAKRDFGNRFIERESSSFTYLGYPLWDKRFQNKKLRQALSMAINRQEISDKIFNGTRAPAFSVISPVVAGSRKDACKYCKYDPAAAKALFQEAGGFQGTMTIWFNSGAGHDAWIQAVANQWRANLGIDGIKFQSLDFAQYLPKLDAHAVNGPWRLGWVMDYPSPQNYLEPLYGSNGSSNNSGYKSAAFDKLVAEGNKAGSIEDGISKYQAAEDLVLEEMPVIPMLFGRIQGVHSEHIENVVIDAFGRVRLADVRVKA